MPKYSADLAYAFLRYFVNSINFTGDPLATVLCIHWCQLWEITWHAVITKANTANGIKIPTLFWKKLGDDVILVQCPFKENMPGYG